MQPPARTSSKSTARDSPTPELGLSTAPPIRPPPAPAGGRRRARRRTGPPTRRWPRPAAGRASRGRRDPDRAAALGVFAHGAAGDAVAARQGEVGLLASDLLTELPATLERLQAAARPEAPRRRGYRAGT